MRPGTLLLHISHTDVRFDSRILKELHGLETLQGYSRVAIGVSREEGASASAQSPNARIITFKLVTRMFSFLPRAPRYALNFLELTAVILVRGLALKPALVHCHDTLVLPAGLVIKLATGCSLVYDAHELESNKNGQTPLLSKITLIIEKLCWRKIDLLVSVSDAINAWYVNYFGPKDHILVLNSPEISTDSEGECDQAARRKYFHRLYDIPDEKLVFLYLGILGAGRGIEICLDAFADPSVHADVVFVGYGELATKIQSYCSKYSNIHLHAPVPHEQVVALARNADVGLCFVENVSLSDYFCLPNKLFEYCFAGLPVLASDFPELRRVVEEYSLGICCTPLASEVRAAIRSVVDNPIPAVSKDLSQLSWSAQASRLRSAYRHLLECG
jgi:glycosyltransferase involved in cell wall biosynthesis